MDSLIPFGAKDPAEGARIASTTYRAIHDPIPSTLQRARKGWLAHLPALTLGEWRNATPQNQRFTCRGSYAGADILIEVMPITGFIQVTGPARPLPTGEHRRRGLGWPSTMMRRLFREACGHPAAPPRQRLTWRFEPATPPEGPLHPERVGDFAYYQTQVAAAGTPRRVRGHIANVDIRRDGRRIACTYMQAGPEPTGPEWYGGRGPIPYTRTVLGWYILA